MKTWSHHNTLSEVDTVTTLSLWHLMRYSYDKLTWRIKTEWRIYAMVKYVDFGSENGFGMLNVHRQANIWNNPGLLFTGALTTNLISFWIEVVQTFWHWKMNENAVSKIEGTSFRHQCVNGPFMPQIHIYNTCNTCRYWLLVWLFKLGNGNGDLIITNWSNNRTDAQYLWMLKTIGHRLIHPPPLQRVIIG